MTRTVPIVTTLQRFSGWCISVVIGIVHLHGYIRLLLR